MTWSVHPAAELFPLLDDDRLAELAEDIEKNGLHEPVWLYDDEDQGETVLLDGRNRLAACRLVDVTPETRMYTGVDPIGFVLSENLHRRHMTAGQLAKVAHSLLPLYDAEAKKRQAHGATAPGRHKETLSQNSGEAFSAKAARQAGEQVGISHWSVETYKRIQRDAPELIPEIDAGTLSLGAALKKVQQASARKVNGTPTSTNTRVMKGNSPPVILKNAVSTLSGVLMALERIDPSALADEEEASQWTADLSKVARFLNHFTKQLKEATYG